MNMPQIVNFRKYISKKKKFRLGEVKMAKLNKIEKTQDLIAGYQEAECLWMVLSLLHKDKHTADGLDKPKQKV